MGFGPIDYFGRTMVENLDPAIRVGVIVVGVGGADIQLFEKNNYQSYLNSAADWLQNYAKEYGSKWVSSRASSFTREGPTQDSPIGRTD